MRQEFQGFTNQLVDEQKAILDQIPHTGTITNISERMEIFQVGLKILNEKLSQKANEFLSSVDEGNENLKEELQSVANMGINNYMEYFKGN